MASSDAQTPAGGDDHLDSLRAGVTKQAGLVRQLKADGAAAALIQDAVTELTSLRKKLDELMAAAGGDANKWKVGVGRGCLRAVAAIAALWLRCLCVTPPSLTVAHLTVGQQARARGFADAAHVCGAVVRDPRGRGGVV